MSDSDCGSDVWPYGQYQLENTAEAAEREFEDYIDVDKKFLERIRALKQSMDNEYKALTPKLSIPTNPTECNTLVNKMIADDAIFWQKWIPILKQTVDKWEIYPGLLRDLEEKFEESFGYGLDSSGAPENYREMHKKCGLLAANLEKLLAQYTDEAYTRQRTVKLQNTLRDLPEGQSDEIVVWYRNCNFYSHHLNRSKSTLPKIAIKGKSAKGTLVRKSAAERITPEIAKRILSHGDIWTSIMLRAVNSFWYNIYQQSDTIIAGQVLTRNPWITPNENMATWGDCALTMYGRMRKWQRVECVDDVDTGYREPELKRLVAAPLVHDMYLRENFKGLQEDAIDPDPLSEMVPLMRDKQKYVRMDPWKLQSKLTFFPNVFVSRMCL